MEQIKTLLMKYLISLGLAGLLVLNACSEKPAAETRAQLLENVSKVDLSNEKTARELLPDAAMFDNLEWNSTTGKAGVPGAEAPLTGWAKGMHPDGNLKVIGHFIEGKENGPCFVWHPNGVKSQQGGFLESKRHGSWIHWDESGKETKRENWDNDVLVK
jgi:antitoxin component YwqK of YwqJK toxin-antitoxin module